RVSSARVSGERADAKPSALSDVRAVRIDLPGLTFRSPNKQVWSKGAAAEAAGARRRMRGIVEVSVRAHANELPESVGTGKHLLSPVRVTLVRVSTRPFDDDNFIASAKPARDGAADAFFLRDDSPMLSFAYRQQRAAEGRQWRTGLIVYLEPMAAET